jgi:hypothetical protein
MDFERIIAADTLAIDKSLRRGFDIVLFFKRIGLPARYEMVVFDLETLSLQQPF